MIRLNIIMRLFVKWHVTVKSRPQLRLRLTVFVVQLVFFFFFFISNILLKFHCSFYFILIAPMLVSSPLHRLNCLFHFHSIARFNSIQSLVSFPFNLLFHPYFISCLSSIPLLYCLFHFHRIATFSYQSFDFAFSIPHSRDGRKESCFHRLGLDERMDHQRNCVTRHHRNAESDWPPP